jgi:hypothetical protein
MNRFRIIGVAATTLAAMLLAVQPAAAAPTRVEGLPATVTDPATGKPAVRVLVPPSNGVRPAPTRPGASAQADTWVYHGRFELRNRYYLDTSGNPNMCLDAHDDGGGLRRNRVGLWHCNGGISEKWHIWQNVSRPDWQFEIWNARTPVDGANLRCLDYPASSGGRNGVQYELWDCVGTPGQKFRMAWNEDLGAYIFAVELGGPHNHIDAFASGGGRDGNPVGNWAWTGHALQHWVLNPA